MITTRIYCRPICPAPPARRENIRFFEYAAAAERAGFRPCMRCRPEVAPSTPAWNGTSTTVARALRLIDDGALDAVALDDFAMRLGVGARQLRRLFNEHVGAPPIAVAQARRVHFARILIEQTVLPIADVAFAAGFKSVRRFNAAMNATYRQEPRHMRRRLKPAAIENEITIRLAYRAPFDWDSLCMFLKIRAIPGVETVTDGRYRRVVDLDGASGIVTVVPAGHNELALSVPNALVRVLQSIVERTRRMFDLAADPESIALQLDGDPLLGPLIRKWPGIRVPGAWDPFEVAVRAVVGQQISVAGATTIMGRLASSYGAPLSSVDPKLTLKFPTPKALAKAAISGMPVTRAHTINEVARSFGSGNGSMAALEGLRGIGPWTLNYIAMRGFNDPDAFPHGDLALRKAAGGMDDRALAIRAEQWRPWRAYAAMLLWRSL